MSKLRSLFASMFFSILWATPLLAQTPPPSVPNTPVAPYIQDINISNWPVMTVPYTDVAVVAIDITMSDLGRRSNLVGLPVGIWIQPRANQRAELNCMLEQGICLVRSNAPGPVELLVGPESRAFSAMWLTINFVVMPAIQANPFQESQSDDLPITISTNQAVAGETITAAVTFPKNYSGRLSLRSFSGGREILNHYFPDGVKMGQRVMLASRRVSTMDNNGFYVDAELRDENGRYVANGFQYAAIASGVQDVKIHVDESLRNIDFTLRYSMGADTNYRILLTRGPGFVLELPVRKFDNGQSVELSYDFGRIGYPVILPRGSYSVTLVGKGSSGQGSTWKSMVQVTNGLSLQDTVELR